MHEHGLADYILQAALKHPQRPAAARPVRIGVLVSEFGGLTPETLQAGLDHVCEHEGLPPVALDVTVVAWLGECPVCGTVADMGESLDCTACGRAGARLCGGDTFVVTECEYGPPLPGGQVHLHGV